jgi:hypothetical protein
LKAGLPDGIFSNQKFQFGKILEGLLMEDVGIFMAIWPILRSFGYILWPFLPFFIFHDNLVQLFRFVVPRKIWQPCFKSEEFANCTTARNLNSYTFLKINKMP